ncbi:MAG: hypothetical protein GY778_29220, partial [bacterium]|nr:hypothetical protein [bacterium]
CIPLDCIPPAEDCWQTSCPSSFYSFEETPIPADFFDPGSDPFTGTVNLEGDTLPDTFIQRLSELCFTSPLPATAQTDIQLTQLSLIGCDPITVLVNDVPEQWDVGLSLSGDQPLGTMTVTKTHPNGGTFQAEFGVKPVFTFTKVGDPGEVRVFDTEAEGFPPKAMQAVGSPPWSDQGAPGSCSSNFAPGAEDDGFGSVCCQGVTFTGWLPHDFDLVGFQPSCNQCLPENDDCADSIVISGETSISFSNIGAITDGPDEPAACNFFGYTNVGADIWYCYKPSCDGQVTVSLCGSAYDTKLAIYDGCACPPTQPPIACNDDADPPSPCFGTLQSEVQFPAVAGNTYLIRIGGYLEDQGDGQLSIVCDPGSGLSCPPFADLLMTEAGQAEIEFGSPDVPAIDPDFFNPGSPLFNGIVTLTGVPLDPDDLGTADTLVERSGPVCVDPGFQIPPVSIQIAELSLTSVQPIDVGGELWLFAMGLSDNQQPGQLLGQQVPPDGGFFNADVPVKPLLAFASKDDLDALESGLIDEQDVTVRILDWDVEAYPPIQYAGFGTWNPNPDPFGFSCPCDPGAPGCPPLTNPTCFYPGLDLVVSAPAPYTLAATGGSTTQQTVLFPIPLNDFCLYELMGEQSFGCVGGCPNPGGGFIEIAREVLTDCQQQIVVVRDCPGGGYCVQFYRCLIDCQ